MYYKNSNSPTISYKPGMGWPSYRDLSVKQISDSIEAACKSSKKTMSNPKNAHKITSCNGNTDRSEDNSNDNTNNMGSPMEHKDYQSDRGSYRRPINSSMPADDYVSPSTPERPMYDKNKYNNGTSIDKEENSRRRDARLLKALYTAINETLLPYVESVVDEYEYLGSPIYSDEGPDRETIAQLIDRILMLSAADIDEIEEIRTEDNIRTEWNRKQMLNNIAEGLLLNEIYAIRRPKYRRIKNNFVYSSGMYDGIAKL